MQTKHILDIKLTARRYGKWAREGVGINYPAIQPFYANPRPITASRCWMMKPQCAFTTQHLLCATSHQSYIKCLCYGMLAIYRKVT